jgi:wyosine [tRNA(Phe)-imidazoG37] synthetase (radical SAM superfamily)
LGIDLVPFKTCSYDCIYCQLGRTTRKTVERKEWHPVNEIIDELKKSLDSKPDYITLGGSGEPTLHSKLGELVENIRSLTKTPIALLTNGSLLWQKEVREQIANVDLAIPSLDAGSPETFEKVNRPHESISFEQMLDGLEAFRNCFNGEFWLEVFLSGGCTDTPEEVKKLVSYAERIKPDKVQLNTVARPPAEEFAKTVSEIQMKEIAKQFTPEAEVVADFRKIHSETTFTIARDSVLQLIQRRPCSIDDVSNGLGIHKNEAAKYLEELIEQKEIECELVLEKRYYRPALK